MFTSFIHGEGSSWSFNQPDGKERHREGKVIFLVTVVYAHHWFPDIFHSLPSIFFSPFLAPPTTPSLSPSLSLSHSLSLSLSPSVPVGLKWLKVTLIWLAFRGSENGRENETTRVQQCTVNTFAPIKLVKTKKKPFGNVTGLIGAPGVHWQKLIPRHSSLHPSATH